MDIDKQDLDEQIEHHHEMLRILRRRLRVQERKEAEYGINVPAEVATEIMTLNERIAKHETELARLRSIAAEGEVPLAEAEYRAALAQAWEPGRPTVAGQAHLEWVRVRSGIKPDRAEALEHEVRAALAEEAIHGLLYSLFSDTCRLIILSGGIKEPCFLYRDVPRIFTHIDMMEPLIRAIYLDLARAITIFTDKLQSRVFMVTKIGGYGLSPALMEEAELMTIINVSSNLDPKTTFAHLLQQRFAAYIPNNHPDYALFERFTDAIVSFLTIEPATMPGSSE